MEHDVILTPSAEKALDDIPRSVRVRILDALEELRTDQHPRGCVKLAGTDDLWRIRVGQYRVIYTIREAERVVVIARVAHRKDAYRGM